MKELEAALERLRAGFADLPEANGPVDHDAMAQVLNETADRLRDNYPYFHPLYAGQMIKAPHPVARLAYSLALWINPNNHALDGGRASSVMEREAVAALARMVGWTTHLGHLTGGGTVANLEALWVAGQLRPGAAIVVGGPDLGDRQPRDRIRPYCVVNVTPTTTCRGSPGSNATGSPPTTSGLRNADAR